MSLQKKTWHKGDLVSKCTAFFDAFIDRVSIEEILNSADHHLLTSTDRTSALFLGISDELNNFYWHFFSQDERDLLEARSTSTIAAGGITAANTILSLTRYYDPNFTNPMAAVTEEQIARYAKRIARLDIRTFSVLKTNLTHINGQSLWQANEMAPDENQLLYFTGNNTPKNIQEQLPTLTDRVGCPILFSKNYTQKTVSFVLSLRDDYQAENDSATDNSLYSEKAWAAAGFSVI